MTKHIQDERHSYQKTHFLSTYTFVPGRVCGMLWKCALRKKVDDHFACSLRITTLSKYKDVRAGRICDMLWKCALREKIDDYFACGPRLQHFRVLYVCGGRALCRLPNCTCVEIRRNPIAHVEKYIYMRTL